MKTRINKSTFFSQFVVALLLFTILSFFQPVYATNSLEVIGSDIGLEVVPLDKNLFSELNLNPGDTVSSKITIRNKYTGDFDLYLRTERLSKEPAPGQPDLYNQLLMTVNLNGKVVYSGSMNGFAKKNINLGRFKPGDAEDINVQVSLPGQSTGNEYMATSLSNKWILTAQVKQIEEVPSLPKTGEIGMIYFLVAGSLMLLVGLFMRKRIYK